MAHHALPGRPEQREPGRPPHADLPFHQRTESHAGIDADPELMRQVDVLLPGEAVQVSEYAVMHAARFDADSAGDELRVCRGIDRADGDVLAPPFQAPPQTHVVPAMGNK